MSIEATVTIEISRKLALYVIGLMIYLILVSLASGNR